MAHAVHTDGGKNQDARIELGFWNFEQLDPQPHQGKIQNQQHHVADVKRGNERPNQIGIGVKQLWPRLDSIVLECAEKNGCGVGRGDTQRQQRNQGGGDGRIVGGLRSGHALDGASGPKFFFVFGKFLFSGIAQKGRYFTAPRRNGAKWKPDEGSTQPGRNRALPLFLGHVHFAELVLGFSGFTFVQNVV